MNNQPIGAALVAATLMAGCVGTRSDFREVIRETGDEVFPSLVSHLRTVILNLMYVAAIDGSHGGGRLPQNTLQPPANAVLRRAERCAAPRRTLSAVETHLAAVQSGHCGPVSAVYGHSGTHLHGFRVRHKEYVIRS